MSDESVSDDNTSEQKMRRAFEARRGSAFTDEEWDEAKRNLVGLFLMLGTNDLSSAEEESSEARRDH